MGSPSPSLLGILSIIRVFISISVSLVFEGGVQSCAYGPVPSKQGTLYLLIIVWVMGATGSSILK